MPVGLGTRDKDRPSMQEVEAMIHKFTVAIRWLFSTAAKPRKGIEQSDALNRVLAEDRPDEREDALTEARGRGRPWQVAVGELVGE
jgi:hypothetical protein